MLHHTDTTKILYADTTKVLHVVTACWYNDILHVVTEKFYLLKQWRFYCNNDSTVSRQHFYCFSFSGWTLCVILWSIEPCILNLVYLWFEPPSFHLDLEYNLQQIRKYNWSNEYCYPSFCTNRHIQNYQCTIGVLLKACFFEMIILIFLFIFEPLEGGG